MVKRTGSKSGVIVKRGAGGKIMGSVKRQYSVGKEAQSGISSAHVITATGKNRQRQQPKLFGMAYNLPGGRAKDINIPISRGYAAQLIRGARKAGTVSRITRRPS